MSRPGILVVAALAAGCGEYRFTPVPECGSDQVLTSDGKALQCVDPRAVGGGLGGVPTCGPGRVLTGDNAGQLACIDVAKANTTIITLTNDTSSLRNRVDALEKKVMDLENKAGGGLFAGVTASTTRGRITSANADVGIAAAAARCATEFGAGAHMCTAHELYFSVTTGGLKASDTVAKSWVYFPAWQNPIAGADEPLAGMGDTCASYTYATTDRKWSGVAVEWTANKQGDGPAFWWHGGAEAPCNQELPIACCR